jgi:hypothetical protein
MRKIRLVERGKKDGFVNEMLVFQNDTIKYGSPVEVRINVTCTTHLDSSLSRNTKAEEAL